MGTEPAAVFSKAWSVLVTDRVVAPIPRRLSIGRI